MNPLHLKVEQNKQVKQLWSGARDILKRSEQPHSGQLIGGSFLKKTLMEGDRKWKWMNERKKMQLFSSALFAIHGKIIEKVHQFSTSGLDRFRLQLGSGLFNAIYHARVRVAISTCFKFTHPTYPPLSSHKTLQVLLLWFQFASPFRGTAPNLEASLASGRCQQ